MSKTGVQDLSDFNVVIKRKKRVKEEEITIEKKDNYSSDIYLDDLISIANRANMCDTRMSHNFAKGAIPSTRTSQYLSIRVPPYLRMKLQELSQKTGYSLSDLVRAAILNLLISAGEFDLNDLPKVRLKITKVTLKESIKGLLRYLGVTRYVRKVVQPKKEQNKIFVHFRDGTVATVDLNKRKVQVRDPHYPNITLEEYIIPREVEIEVEA